MPSTVPIRWDPADTPETLKAAYRAERHGPTRTRLHALWLLRRGWPAQTTADAVGRDPSTVPVWLRGYREGGLTAVGTRQQGGHGKPSCLTPEQEAQVVAAAQAGHFSTAEDARVWIAQELGVTYRGGSIYTVLHRLGLRPKVPRSVPVRADPPAQHARKKGDSRTPSKPPV